MPKFPTAYDHQTGVELSLYTPAGERYQKTYIESLSETGQPILKESGTVDLYELHQTGRELCDLKTMILRYQRGDLDALNVRDGFYADVTELPQTPQDVARLAVEARSLFMRQSASDRAEYGNSVNKWLEAVMKGEEKALESIGIKVAPKPVDTVTDNAESAAEVIAKGGDPA